LLNVFETFLPQLLMYPNPADPLNGEAAALLMNSPEEYRAKVQGTAPAPCLTCAFCPRSLTSALQQLCASRHCVLPRRYYRTLPSVTDMLPIMVSSMVDYVRRYANEEAIEAAEYEAAEMEEEELR